MDITKEYSLEQLTADTVNVAVISYADIESKRCEISRSRMAYSNSPTGRKLLEEALPEEYKKAVFAIWGKEATLKDPSA